ncbi:hydrogenase maturation nickel metallochaperone HypA [uncultured Cohaesibacter sp.]|uniref:hydrogenase maturation nickel metallochaperone HypA n=1 Tax=uncultured Cohaesibacter sp. TaxID=1002546 RepID=UPI0029C6A878|nr:hydrogenase maturation nickel metallochaperone HypA [uncultured Cohaesibacter sp.]
MHEMSICEGILQVIEDQAAKQAFSRVKKVRLEIGPLAGVEMEALMFSYDVVCRNSIADGSELDVIKLPVSAWCMQCSKPTEVAARYDACPDCGSYQVEITGGDELRIKDMEVE